MAQRRLQETPPPALGAWCYHEPVGISNCNRAPPVVGVRRERDVEGVGDARGRGPRRSAGEVLGAGRPSDRDQQGGWGRDM